MIRIDGVGAVGGEVVSRRRVGLGCYEASTLRRPSFEAAAHGRLCVGRLCCRAVDRGTGRLLDCAVPAFDFVWPRDSRRALVSATRSDRGFWLAVVQAGVFGVLSLLAFWHLARRQK